MAPRMINFKPGSIIYFMGDKADSVYLLKEGKVTLEFEDLQTGEEQAEFISNGEFFGVKSGLIKFPREETAKVSANSTIIEFNSNDFEALITKNTGIILKMLKVFSNQLRRIGKQVQSLVTDKVTSDPSDDFFNIGEYYLKNKKYSQAITVYNRYLDYYPTGKLSTISKQRLAMAKSALDNYGEGGGPTPNLENPTTNPAYTEKKAVEEDKSYSSEEEKIYYKGVSFMSSSKYGDAFNEFKKVLKSDNEEYKILATFEIGKCLYYVKKYNDCIQHFSSFLSKNPKFNDAAVALYFMGNSYKMINDKSKATEIFQKILSITKPSDDIYRKTHKALKEI